MQRVPSIFKNDGRHPERPDLSERSTLTNRTIPRAKAFICCVNVTSKVSPKVSPPFWTMPCLGFMCPVVPYSFLSRLSFAAGSLGLDCRGL